MGDFVFSPLKTIILLESFLQITDKTSVSYLQMSNYINDSIDIFNNTTSIDEISNKMENLIVKDVPLNIDLKTKISDAIIKLKLLCDTENMMQCFMDTLHLIQK